MRRRLLILISSFLLMLFVFYGVYMLSGRSGSDERVDPPGGDIPGRRPQGVAGVESS